MIHVHDDAASAARALAERAVEIAAAALAARAEFRVGLSGGSLARAYRILADGEHRGRIDWARTVVLFADERAVPPDHPDSNHRRVRETLLDPAGVAPRRVHRIPAELVDLDGAAREYEPHLAAPLDLLLLGVGEDGHTASIFPDSAAAREGERRAVAVTDSPKPPPRRITVTPRVIREARRIAVLATGSGKARAVAAALARDADPILIPAALLADADWHLDRAAAALLDRAG